MGEQLQAELLGLLMTGRYSFSDLLVMVSATEREIRRELNQLCKIEMVNACTPDGDRAEPPFKHDIILTA